jgi:hypothetical protein
MADPQRMVEQLRHFLHSADQTAGDALRVLAQEYAEVCAEVNQRLRRCDDFLRQGLLSEAIHFAEQSEPPLLDLLALVDFPERAQWDQVVLAYQLPPGPPLRLDTAEALNQAYVQLQPSAQLLREHRRLALARAPLPERLAVMRRLAVLESGNPLWEQDIRDFERARGQELQTEVEQACARQDTDRLSLLLHELLAPAWLVPPSPALAEMVRGHLSRDSARRGRQQLEQLANALHEAFGARDEELARKLLEEWQTLAHDLEVTPADRLCGDVAAVRDWLHKRVQRQEEERAYLTDLEALEKGLRSARVGEEALQELYNAVATSKQGVPEQVEAAYQERRQTLRRASDRRERLILGLTVGLGTLAAVAFVLFLILRSQ